MLTHKVGDYQYRVEQPSIALGKTGKATVITVTSISPWFEKLCLSADLLILHLLSEHDLLPIIEDRKREKRPTLYELSDNILSLHCGIGVRKWFSDPVNLALACQYMRLADAVQVTGQGLAEQFSFINSNMVIFENQMRSLGTCKRESGGRVVIGWAGSSGHKTDIEEIRDVLAGIIRDTPYVDFSFMGDKAIYDLLSTKFPPGRLFYTPAGTLEEYLTFLQDLDIGVAPLQDNPYNRCRSDVKFLEYASRAVVPVLRSLTPYVVSAEHGKTAFLYDSPQDLSDILSRLANNRELRESVGCAAYEYVKNSRIEEFHANRRLDFYYGLLNNREGTSTIPSGMPVIRCCEGSEYYEVAASPAESLLVEGINLDSSGRYDEAIKTYLRAASTQSDYSLPWFWLGYSAARRGDARTVGWFNEAVKRNPRSLRSWWLKAKFKKDLEPMAAFSELAELQNRWPLYAPAAFSMAEVLEMHNEYDEALHWYDEALRANPSFSSPAVGLGRIYEIQGKAEKAGLAYGTAADLAPTWADAQYAMARWCFSRNDLQGAAGYCSRALMADSKHNDAIILSKKILSE
jgi:tetratricopeptide (TPR) repeat protein